MRFVVVSAVLSLLLSACPAPLPTEGEGEPGDEGEGEGTGEGEGEGEVGAPLLASCTDNADCASGTCTSFFDGDFANDFCVDVCDTDADCDFGDQASRCLPLSAAGNICFPTCETSADCSVFDGDGTLGACFVNQNVDENLCFQLNGSGFCDDGSACGAGEACTLVGSGLKFEFVCTPSAAGDVGEACDATALARRGLPCEAFADCPTGFACVDEDARDGANSGARVCSASEELNCGAFICWDQGFCAGACNADDDCPEGWGCETFDFGGPELVQLCRPAAGSRAPCDRDADCTVAGEVCSLHNDDDATPVTVCTLPTAGDVLPGGACGDDRTTLDDIEPTSGCTSNLCVNNGTCGVICAADDDCGGNACLKLELGNDTPENVLGVCGTGPRCDNDVDCGASPGAQGALCVRTQGPEGSVGVCTTDVRGDLLAGATCDEATNFNLAAGDVRCFGDGDCEAVGGVGYACDRADNRCVPPASALCGSGCFFGHCLQICASTADCDNAGADFVCSGDEEVVDDNDRATDADDETDDFGLCIFLPGTRSPCGSSSDCITGEVCNVVVERATLRVETVCTSRGGEAALAAACGVIGTAFIQCDDVCAADDVGTASHCRAVCDGDSDCDDGLVCRAYDLDNERRVNLCQPDDGAGGIGEGEGEAG